MPAKIRISFKNRRFLLLKASFLADKTDLFSVKNRRFLIQKSTELSCLKLLSVIEDVVLCHVDLANHRF